MRGASPSSAMSKSVLARWRAKGKHRSSSARSAAVGARRAASPAGLARVGPRAVVVVPSGGTRVIHKGQRNRTNIPKRDTDGSDQSSHSTLDYTNQSGGSPPITNTSRAKGARRRRPAAFMALRHIGHGGNGGGRGGALRAVASRSSGAGAGPRGASPPRRRTYSANSGARSHNGQAPCADAA